MIIFANILIGIAAVLNSILFILIIIVIARAIISWVNPDPYNPIVRFLHATTEPLLGWLRKFIPIIGGRLDLTPLILLFFLIFLRIALVQTLQDYAHLMRVSGLQSAEMSYQDRR